MVTHVFPSYKPGDGSQGNSDINVHEIALLKQVCLEQLQSIQTILISGWLTLMPSSELQ